MRAACLFLGALFAGAAPAQSPPTGKALFHEKCAMCHAEGGMGTGLLARRMDPKVAALENRTDLTPAFVTQAARIGIGNMPMIARGEVSDTQMAAIAAYLAKGNK
jgi:mono/diheme cytochrome c family protein